jgi:hypothetical protein
MRINGNGLFPESVPWGETIILYETRQTLRLAMKRDLFAGLSQ